MSAPSCWIETAAEVIVVETWMLHAFSSSYRCCVLCLSKLKQNTVEWKGHFEVLTCFHSVTQGGQVLLCGTTVARSLLILWELPTGQLAAPVWSVECHLTWILDVGLLESFSFFLSSVFLLVLVPVIFSVSVIDCSSLTGFTCVLLPCSLCIHISVCLLVFCQIMSVCMFLIVLCLFQFYLPVWFLDFSALVSWIFFSSFLIDFFFWSLWFSGFHFSSVWSSFPGMFCFWTIH